MGFSIRGGLEYGCGVFVSEVLTSSKAAQAGLKVIFNYTHTVTYRQWKGWSYEAAAPSYSLVQ